MSRQTLQTRRRFLRFSKLLPGDVLLSRGTGRESDQIARLTFGPFSHAAIYVTFGVVFEAISDGVGFTGLELAKHCDHGVGYLVEVSHYAHVEVRRHPKIERQCATPSGADRVVEELARVLISENGKEYPPLRALAHAVPMVPAVVVYPYLFVAARHVGEGHKTVPGLFCSQLVCKALTRLCAYPLRPGFLGRRLPPHKISPNNLQFRRSLLNPVRDAVVDDTFPCEEFERDSSRQAQREAEHARMLQEAKTRQAEALAPRARERAVKLRIAVDTLNSLYGSRDHNG
jgi:hypothetical protein